MTFHQQQLELFDPSMPAIRPEGLHAFALEFWRGQTERQTAAGPADSHLHGGGYHVERDAQGRPKDVVDANGKVVEKFQYDKTGHVKRVTFADGSYYESDDGGKTYNAYDANGNKTPGQPFTNLKVDRDGNVSFDNPGIRSHVTLCRDGYVIVAQDSDAAWRKRAEHAHREYDAHGRLTSVDDENGKPIRTFHYGKDGKLDGIKDGHFTWRRKPDGSWEYKEAGSNQWHDGATPSVDKQGNVSWTVSVTLPDGSRYTARYTDMIDGRFLNSPFHQQN